MGAAALQRIDRVAGDLAGLALLAIVLVNGVAIAFRYLLDAPLSWSEEVMRYTNIWLTFLGAASAFVRDEHMAISSPLPTVLRPALRVLSLLVAISLSLALIVLGTGAAVDNLAQRSPSAGILMAIPYAALPLSGALILVSAVAKLAALRGPAEGPRPAGPEA